MVPNGVMIDMNHPMILPVSPSLRKTRSEECLYTCDMVADDSADTSTGAKGGHHWGDAAAFAEQDGAVRPPFVRPILYSNDMPGIYVKSSERCSSGDVRAIRQWLSAQGYAEAEELFSDTYLTMVMSRIKDGKTRTFEYSAEKLAASLKLRRELKAASITRADVARSLAPGHMWWDGQDRLGRPVLCVRPAGMDLSTYDTDEYLRAHVYLIEEGLAIMRRRAREGHAPKESFVMVVDASGLGFKHLDMKLMRGMLALAMTAYPDRLGAAVIAPVNMVVRSAWAVLSKLMSPNMASKITLGKSLRPLLADILPGDAEARLRDILHKLQGER